MLPLKEQTWILGFLNVRTVESGGTLLLHTEFKDQNTLSIIVLTKQSTTVIIYDIAKLISKLTPLD